MSLHVHLSTLNLLGFLGLGDREADGASEYCLLTSRERAAILLLLRATLPTRGESLDDVVSRRDAEGSWSFAPPNWGPANLARARIEEAMAPD